MCWWCSNGKKQSPNPYQVQLFPVPWTTLSNNPDLQRNPTYNHTRHHILSALWWREQRFPFNRLNNRPRLHRASAVMWIRVRRSPETGLKSCPGPHYGNLFTWGKGSRKKVEGENTGIPLRSHSPAVVQPESRDEAASANISQNRQRYIHHYLSSFICMKTVWKRPFSVI